MELSLRKQSLAAVKSRMAHDQDGPVRSHPGFSVPSYSGYKQLQKSRDSDYLDSALNRSRNNSALDDHSSIHSGSPISSEKYTPFHVSDLKPQSGRQTHDADVSATPYDNDIPDHISQRSGMDTIVTEDEMLELRSLTEDALRELEASRKRERQLMEELIQTKRWQQERISKDEVGKLMKAGDEAEAVELRHQVSELINIIDSMKKDEETSKKILMNEIQKKDQAKASYEQQSKRLKTIEEECQRFRTRDLENSDVIRELTLQAAEMEEQRNQLELQLQEEVAKHYEDKAVASNTHQVSLTIAKHRQDQFRQLNEALDETKDLQAQVDRLKESLQLEQSSRKSAKERLEVCEKEKKNLEKQVARLEEATHSGSFAANDPSSALLVDAEVHTLKNHIQVLEQRLQIQATEMEALRMSAEVEKIRGNEQFSAVEFTYSKDIQHVLRELEEANALIQQQSFELEEWRSGVRSTPLSTVFSRDNLPEGQPSFGEQTTIDPETSSASANVTELKEKISVQSQLLLRIAKENAVLRDHLEEFADDSSNPLRISLDVTQSVFANVADMAPEDRIQTLLGESGPADSAPPMSLNRKSYVPAARSRAMAELQRREELRAQLQEALQKHQTLQGQMEIVRSLLTRFVEENPLPSSMAADDISAVVEQVVSRCKYLQEEKDGLTADLAEAVNGMDTIEAEWKKLLTEANDDRLKVSEENERLLRDLDAESALRRQAESAKKRAQEELMRLISVTHVPSTPVAGRNNSNSATVSAANTRESSRAPSPAAVAPPSPAAEDEGNAPSP